VFYMCECRCVPFISITHDQQASIPFGPLRHLFHPDMRRLVSTGTGHYTVDTEDQPSDGTCQHIRADTVLITWS